MKSAARAIAVLGVLLLAGGIANASTIWDGPTITFTNPAQAFSQDRLTPEDWLTRGNTQGLYNASTEGGFTHFLSPADTRWANGTLANYSSLSYSDWDTWAKNLHGGPQNTIGVPAVVHLLTDDIYLSIDFISWGGPSGGGEFSYVRSTATPEPSTLLLSLAFGASVIGIRWWRRKTA